MAINAYFFLPLSGNGYKPYTYDFDAFFGSSDISRDTAVVKREQS